MQWCHRRRPQMQISTSISTLHHSDWQSQQKDSLSYQTSRSFRREGTGLSKGVKKDLASTLYLFPFFRFVDDQSFCFTDSLLYGFNRINILTMLDLFFFRLVPIIPEFLYAIRHRHDNVSVVTETTESFATYTTSTMPGLYENGAYEEPGTNVTSRCLPDSAKRKSVTLHFLAFIYSF